MKTEQAGESRSLQVLLVDDDRDDYILTRGVLMGMRGTRPQLEWVADSDAALEALARGAHDVALIDYRLGEHNGVELVRDAVSRGYRTPLILLTGQGDHDIDVEAMHAGAADFLHKNDLNSSLLERSIRYAIERRNSKDELENSISILRATLESTADGILVIDASGHIVGHNRKFAEMLRVPTEFLEARDDKQMLQLVLSQLVDPDAFLARERHIYADPHGASFDVLHLRDGRIFERYSQPQIIDGQSVGRVWNFRDVSEREKRAEALRHSEALKAAMMETALDCVITMNSEGRIVEWNPAAERTFGYTRSQALGQIMHDLIVPPELREHHNAGLQRFLASGEGPMLNRRIETTATRADGSELMVELSVVPIPTTGEEGPMFTGYLRDITERKRAEDELRRRAEFEALLAYISTSFIDLPSGEMDKGINHALQAIGAYSQVDRAYVFLWSDDGRTMSNTHEWCASGIEPQIERLQELPTERFPWLSNHLRSFDSIYVPRVRDLPEEAQAEREEFEFEGIQSIVMVPMVYRGCLVGQLGFDSVRDEKSWSEEDIGLLRIAGEMFVNAVERKRSEESLRHSEARNRALLGAIPDMIVRAHRDGTILDLLSGPELDSVAPIEADIGRNVRDILTPEIVPQALLCIQRALDSHGVETLEYQLARSGEMAFFEARMVASGLDEVTAIVRDVSARQRAEAEILRLNEGLEQRVEERTTELAHINAQLQQERARMTDLLANVPGVVFEEWFQPDEAQGRINFVSDHITTMLGYSKQEWMSSFNNWTQSVHPEDREQLERNIAPLPKRMGTENSIFRMISKDGRVVWNESQSRVIRDWDGTPLGVRGVTMDITERKRAEAALQAAKEEADRANGAKSEFLSRMSHELRTPLNAVLGFGQILEMGTLSNSQREGVGHILKAGRHLLDLINEVLEITSIEAGRLSLSPEPVGVKMAVREVLDLTRPLADGLSIQLQSEVPDHDDHYILADQQRLKQVLLNLVSNAIKYNRAGGSVRVSCEPTSPDCLRLSISDTGAGLSEDDMARLFTPFERLGAERTRIEGTGIGLALSKRLVEAMNGRIGVASTLEQGSTFWLELPLTTNPLASGQTTADVGEFPSSLPSAAHEGKLVLYIDDNLSNLRVIEMLLSERPDIRLITAMQGSTGIDLAREHRPDLILLDLHLCDINGDEVLRRLRVEPATQNIPVAMVSADATAGEVQRLLAAGACAYMTKPLDVQEFLQVLDETLQEGDSV